jgi:hypothetical protein
MTPTAAQLITTNIFAMAVLPAGHRMSNFILYSAVLDTGSPLAPTWNVGILNSYYNTALDSSPQLSSNSLMAASTVSQAGGWAAPGATVKPEMDLGTSLYDRIVAMQLAAAPTTAASGKIAVAFTIDQ